MIAAEEMPRTWDDEKYYYMHYKNIASTQRDQEDYSSKDQAVTKQELEIILQKFNYFCIKF